MTGMRRARRQTPDKSRVFLDNNMWNALVDATGPLTTDALVDAYKYGSVEVVATIELCEEILGTARRKPAKYNDMRRLLRRLFGRRVLLPLRERNMLEITTGGVLPSPNQFLPRSVIERVVGLKANEDVVQVINDEVYELKRQSGQRDRNDVDGIVRGVEALGATVYDYAHVVTPEMVRETTIEALSFAAEHGYPTVPDDEVNFGRVPSLWLYCAAGAASTTRAAGAGTAVRDSDNHDRLHCSAGAYYDVLVTVDREFRARLALIPDCPFDVMNPNEFTGRLAAAR
jgi:hypothetical protein